jgi:hypothetical protein
VQQKFEYVVVRIILQAGNVSKDPILRRNPTTGSNLPAPLRLREGPEDTILLENRSACAKKKSMVGRRRDVTFVSETN